jgi:four helix bundle protein
MASNFKSLLVYQRARALADELHPLVREWPQFDRDSTGMQLMCSVDSVAANVAEAGGRWTLKDKRHFLYIARGSLLETEHWLDCAASRGLLSTSMDGQVTEIARLLNGLIDRPGPAS